MTIALHDRVADTWTGTGTTSPITLAGSAPTGYRTFASAVSDAATCHYTIANGSEWETGQGVFTLSGTTLTRATIYASSNGGSIVSFSAGTKTVYLSFSAALASRIENITSGQLGSGSVFGRNGAGGSTGSLASGSIARLDLGNACVASGTMVSGAIHQWALSANCVQSGHVGNGAVTSGSIASGQISQMHHAANSVTSGHLGNASVTSGAVASGAVGFPHLADGSVRSGTVASGQISQFHHAANSVMSGHVQSGSIGIPHLADGSVRSGTVASGQIAQSHVASGFVAQSVGLTAQVPTEELISGLRVVHVSPNGNLRITMPSVSGRQDVFGVVQSNVASGQIADVLVAGKFQATSGMVLTSGFVGQKLYCMQSGQVGPISGQFGGLSSGSTVTEIGTAFSGGAGFFRIGPTLKFCSG